MSLTEITGILNQIYESMGLPPLVLIFVIALFLFVFIFGLVILVKVRSIRRDLIVVNKSLDALNLGIRDVTGRLAAKELNRNKDKENLKFVLQRQAAIKTSKQISNRLHRLSDIDNQNRNKDKNSPDNRDDELLDNGEEKNHIKNKILDILKIKGRPVPYSEIIKHLSRDFLDYDFDLILKELEQLKRHGKLVDQYSAGKLYYRIKK